MGRPILLLRLEGPLQSWGTRSRWDVRDTGLEPTKSGVIGLLGCALGYASGDPRLLALNDALRFGVRIEHAGTVMTDYQTITDYLPTAAGQYKVRGGVKSSLESIRRDGDAPATIISPRAYLEDAAFLAGLAAMDAGGTPLLEECATAVKNPKWPLYLGRKACVPTRPVFAWFGDAYDDLDEAFSRHQWEWLGALGRKRREPRGKLTCFIEDETGGLQRQDVMQGTMARTYGFRNAVSEFRAPVLNETVDGWEVK